MRLEYRVARLEAVHKWILRCAWCRYALTDLTPTRKDKYRAVTANIMATKCWYCGTPYVLKLSRTDKHYREAADLVHNSHPIKRLTVERIHAAELWLSLSKSEKEGYLKNREEKAERKASPRPTSQQAYRPTIRPNAKERKAQAERDDLRDRARVFIQDRQEEFKRRAGRTEPFPIDETLKALEASRCHSFDSAIKEEAKSLGLDEGGQPFYSYTSHIATIRNFILELKKREACEVMLWGAALPETLEEIAFFEALLPTAAAEALEEQREAKEKAAREAAERQREREEYLARVRGDKPTTAQTTVPQQSATSNVEEYLRSQMGEATYNAWKEARQRSSRATDEQGRRMIEIPYIAQEIEPTPPPDDGTIRYQQKLAHWKMTGVWPPDKGQEPRW